MHSTDRVIKTITFTDSELEEVTLKCIELVAAGWSWVCGGIDDEGIWGDFDPNLGSSGMYIIQLDLPIKNESSC